MELTKSFPPTDDLIIAMQEIDYKKLFNDYMDFVVNACAVIAAVTVILWERAQTMKITTPDSISDYFYFNLNMRGAAGDEIVGISVFNFYVGLYGNSISWGILDENGCL